ncbi:MULTISPECIES: hypothetical protein [unclassified Anabaena]|uniref:hypothetical protein n=1 Tax=unclassified Anabaena TaxID=2619674 RepID=UPI00082B628F|nr:MULTISPECIES: hypothetical protein [unclassified Anabaena]
MNNFGSNPLISHLSVPNLPKWQKSTCFFSVNAHSFPMKSLHGFHYGLQKNQRVFVNSFILTNPRFCVFHQHETAISAKNATYLAQYGYNLAN